MVDLRSADVGLAADEPHAAAVPVGGLRPGRQAGSLGFEGGLGPHPLERSRPGSTLLGVVADLPVRSRVPALDPGGEAAVGLRQQVLRVLRAVGRTRPGGQHQHGGHHEHGLFSSGSRAILAARSVNDSMRPRYRLSVLGGHAARPMAGTGRAAGPGRHEPLRLLRQGPRASSRPRIPRKSDIRRRAGHLLLEAARARSGSIRLRRDRRGYRDPEGASTRGSGSSSRTGPSRRTGRPSLATS